MRGVFCLGLLTVLGACAPLPELPAGQQAYDLLAPTEASRDLAYRIGPGDTIRVNVFQEPSLSLADIPVDDDGSIEYPLLGTVQAAGRTSRDLAGEIAARLDERFLVDPQVTVSLVQSVSRRIVVEGQVNDPGVYPVTGATSLIEAVALADGPTEIARLNEVIVFRTVGEERYAAMFDLREIRAGRAEDPAIYGTDVVIVGRSGLRAAYRDLLTLAPALTAIFVRIP